MNNYLSKQKSKILLIGIILLSIVSITSCENGALSGSFDIGALVPVDSDGHFKEEMVYTLLNYSYGWNNGEYRPVRITDTYSTDGAFNEVVEMYEGVGFDLDGNGTDNEGYFLYMITSGTYSYDSTSYTLTTSEESGSDYYSEIWDDVNLEWVYTYTGVASDFTYSENESTDEVYFTTHSTGSVYKSDGTGWTNSHTYTWDTYAYSSERTYTITDTSWEYHYVSHNSDINDPVTGDISYESKYTVDLTDQLPADVVFDKGVTKFFNGFYSDYQKRYWDYTTSTMGAWVVDPYGYIGDRASLDVTHFGDFIVFNWELTDYERSMAEPRILRDSHQR